MGMTIEEAIKYYENKNVVLTEEEAEANTIALNTMRKYQMFQDQSLSLYMERLKADMAATLTDIQSEFKEGLRCKGCCNNCVNACEDIPAGWFLDFIDAKINSLKESTDGME